MTDPEGDEGTHPLDRHAAISACEKYRQSLADLIYLLAIWATLNSPEAIFTQDA